MNVEIAQEQKVNEENAIFFPETRKKESKANTVKLLF